SNFARTAMQSRHNSKYWTREPYLGFGVDAHSMLELVWGRAPSPVQAERSSAPARAHGNSRFAIGGVEEDRHQAVRFATPDALDAYMNRAPHTVTPVSAQAAIEESFFLGLRLNRGIDLEQLRQEFSAEFGHTSLNCHPERSEGPAVCQPSASTKAPPPGSLATVSQDATAAWNAAAKQSLQEGLLEQQGAILRLTARGRLLSNEVFARFLAEETKVGTGHVNPR